MSVRTWWSWGGDHFLVLAAAFFFVVVAYVFMVNPPRSEWQSVFVRAALRMQAGETIHVQEVLAYTYPPAMAMVAMPLAILPLHVGAFGWYLVNVLATIVTFVCAWRLAGGPALVRLKPPWTAIFWLATLLSFRFFVAPLGHQQFDMVIAALLMSGCCRIWRGHDLSGAALVGASAAMKCTPLLFAPYLLWRGKLRAAGLLVVVAVGLNLVPDLLWPQESGRWYLADWASSFLGVVAREAPGAWHGDPLQNQSLSALFGRVAQFAVSPRSTDPAALTLPPAVHLPVRLAVYATGLTLLGATAWMMGRPGRAAPAVSVQTKPQAATPQVTKSRNPGIPESLPPGTPAAFRGLQTGAEAAAVVCLMLLLSPMSSKAHYVVTLLPSLLIARAVVERRSRWLRWLLIPLVICSPLTTKGLIGKSLGDLTLMWGLPTWYALLSLIGIWVVLAAVRSDAEVRQRGKAGANVGRPAVTGSAGGVG